MLGKQFQRMRRRLTVTGASSNIDGVVGKGQDQPEPKKSKKKKVCCFLSVLRVLSSCPFLTRRKRQSVRVIFSHGARVCVYVIFLET